MQLPGGVSDSGTLRKDFAFRRINGELELALAEHDPQLSLPEQVTQLLVKTVDHIAGEVVQDDHVADLCVGDRQFLLQQMAIALGDDVRWMSAVCQSCEEIFDFKVQLSKLPVKKAGCGFPAVKVKTSKGNLHFRLPTGRDQSVIANLDDPEQARNILLRRCFNDVDKKFIQDGMPEFENQDLEIIDQAMEAIAPEVLTELETNCPVCGNRNRIELDPYKLLDSNSSDIFTEIHTLAWFYHWSEAEILAMPRSRRKRYLDYIDRSCGNVSHSVNEQFDPMGSGAG